MVGRSSASLWSGPIAPRVPGGPVPKLMSLRLLKRLRLKPMDSASQFGSKTCALPSADERQAVSPAREAGNAFE